MTNLSTCVVRIDNEIVIGKSKQKYTITLDLYN